MPELLLPGVAATRVETPRLTQQVLHAEGVEPAGAEETVLFVHGNVSSSLFWQQPLLALAETRRVRGLAVDLRGYGDTDALPARRTPRRDEERRAPERWTAVCALDIGPTVGRQPGSHWGARGHSGGSGALSPAAGRR